jgi:hypothetical protein
VSEATNVAVVAFRGCTGLARVELPGGMSRVAKSASDGVAGVAALALSGARVAPQLVAAFEPCLAPGWARSSAPSLLLRDLDLHVTGLPKRDLKAGEARGTSH